MQVAGGPVRARTPSASPLLLLRSLGDFQLHEGVAFQRQDSRSQVLKHSSVPQKGLGAINAETSPQPRPQICLDGPALGHRPGHREDRCERQRHSADCCPWLRSAALQGRGS